MAKKMLIDATHPEETRVAVAEGNRLEELDYESSHNRQLRGNIYLAKVTRVEPSLQAAFVEYGGNRHGFLAFDEIHPDYYQIPFEDRQKLLEEEQAENESEDDEAEESASGEADDESIVEAELERRRRRALKRYKIQEVIKRRQILLVQVVKEERGNKGAALTTYLSLAGRYCVLMPNTSRGGGISRKITNAADRKRLKGVVSELDISAGMGLIIRTAGAKRTKSEVKRDADYLLRVWEQIRETTMKSIAPTLIHEEGNLVKRAIRDMYDKDIESVLVQGDDAYRQAKEFMKVLMPSHARKVQAYKDDIPLFQRYQMEDQIEQIYHPTVQLKSGGYLVINTTEALVSIDVNSGRATKERNIEATALKTNLEAADEACRQMRLRDLAGLLVIDFIDMEENKNNRAVEKRLKDALKVDRARVQTSRISQFGLLEMSRQRRRASMLEGSTSECPACGGLGFIRSGRSAALLAFRKLEQEAANMKPGRVRLTVPTDVAMYLLNEMRQRIDGLEQRLGQQILIEVDAELIAPDMKIEQAEVFTGEAAEAAAQVRSESVQEEQPADDKPKRRRRRRGGKDDSEAGGQVEPETTDSESDDSDETSEQASGGGSDEDSESKPKRRRRRGRRGGRGRRRSTDNNAESNDGQSQDSKQAEASNGEDASKTGGDSSDDKASDAEMSETSETPESEDKPKRSRRSRSRKTPESGDADGAPKGLEIVETLGGSGETSSTPEPLTSGESSADKLDAEAPKKRRSRAKPKPAEAETDAKAEDASTESGADTKPEEDATPKASDKPARKPRAAAKPKAEAVAEVEAKPDDTPAPEPAANDDDTADKAAEPSKPKKRGWWSRG